MTKAVVVAPIALKTYAQAKNFSIKIRTSLKAWVGSEDQNILSNGLSASPVAIVQSESKSLNYWLDDADGQRLPQVVGKNISNCDRYH